MTGRPRARDDAFLRGVAAAYLSGTSCEAIATEHGVSAAAVRTWVHRARRLGLVAPYKTAQARHEDFLAEVEQLRADAAEVARLREALTREQRLYAAYRKGAEETGRAMRAEIDRAEARGRAIGHVAGLREAAEMVDVDDDCGCGGCESCTSRQDAARILAHADLMTDALTGITGGAS